MDTAVQGVLLAAIAAVTVLAVLPGPGPFPDPFLQDSARAVVPPVLAAIPAGSTVTIDIVPGAEDRGVGEAIEWQLEAQGRIVSTARAPRGDWWGSIRQSIPIDDKTIHLAVLGTDDALQPTLPGGWTRIAFDDSRTPRDRADAKALAPRIQGAVSVQWDALTHGRHVPTEEELGIDRATIDRYLQLHNTIITGVYIRTG